MKEGAGTIRPPPSQHSGESEPEAARTRRRHLSRKESDTPGVQIGTVPGGVSSPHARLSPLPPVPGVERGGKGLPLVAVMHSGGLGCFHVAEGPIRHRPGGR